MATLASIIVDNMATTTRWVDKLVVECYKDADLTQVVGVKYADVSWNGVYNMQKNPVSFQGLVQGQTYWIRAGVMAQTTHRTTYNPPYSLIAGNSGTPTASYQVTQARGPNGITLRCAPQNAAANHDYYEGFWQADGLTAPTSSTPAVATPLIVSGGEFQFFMGMSAGQRFDVYVRAVDTGRNKQDWTYVGTFSAGSMDDVADGTIFGRIRNLALTNGGYVDPRRTGVIKLGSVNPAWMKAGWMYYEKAPQDATYAKITLSWTGLQIFRADGSVTAVADLVSPGLPIYNLNYNTTYSLLARHNEFGVASSQTNTPVSFVTANVAHGSPPIAFPPGTVNESYLAQQGLHDYIELAGGAIQITTVANSGSGSTGGTGGGNGSCPRLGMKVLTRERGVVRVETLHIGDHLWTPYGWKQVLSIAFEDCEEFIQVEGWDDEIVEIHPMTDMIVNDGEVKKAHELSLTDILTRSGGVNPRIKNLRLLKKTKDNDDGTWVHVKLHIEDPHWFFCGKHNPTIAIHNLVNQNLVC